MLIVSERFKTQYPGAVIGLLAMRGLSNPEGHALLDGRKTELETELRSRYGSLDRARLKAHPTLQAYGSYYKKFGKTYHLQLQLESVVFKGRPLPQAAALVEAMFMSELRGLLLTAGHDLDTVRGQVTADVASGEEQYTLLGGATQRLKTGDMFLRDEQGVLSSVLYGPDHRTRLTVATTAAAFTVYVPAGVARAAVEEHLAQIEAYLLLVAPGAQTRFLGVLG